MNIAFQCKGKDLVRMLNVAALSDVFIKTVKQGMPKKRTSRPSKSN